MKSFHSTLQKSDTIQENELLIGYKKQINVLKKAQEAAFVEQQKQALEVCCSCVTHLAIMHACHLHPCSHMRPYRNAISIHAATVFNKV